MSYIKIWFSIALALIFFHSIGQNSGDNIFQSKIIHRIDITFSQTSWWDSLNTYYLQGNEQYLIGDVKIDAQQINFAGVRIKGVSSYYQIIDSSNKISLKIDFNKYIPGQDFDGLRKLNLNNGYSDPTFMREKIFLDFLNKQGLIAPRCTYAEVYINGSYWGFYMLVEQIDPTFLNTKFGDNTGNLFKAPHGGASLEWEGNNQTNYYDNFELRTNEGINDWSDMVNLCDIINNTSNTQFKDSLETILASGHYIKMWAANNLFVNFDVYEYAANNFYIYDNPFDNKFYWIAWDVNAAFGSSWWSMPVVEKENLSVYYLPNPPPPPLTDSVPLTVRMLQDTFYANEYTNTLCNYLNGNFKTKYLYNLIDSLYNWIKPFVYADSNKLYTDQQFENNINFTTSIASGKELPGLKPFITGRINSVSSEIGCIVGVNDMLLSNEYKVNIYPNPFSISATIEIKSALPDPEPVITLIIYDLLGNVVERVEINNYTARIKRNNLSPGIYFYKLTDGKGTLTNGKIMIQ